MEITMAFTQDNTSGYTDEQLAAFNAEFNERIALADSADHADIFKALADEIAGR